MRRRSSVITRRASASRSSIDRSAWARRAAAYPRCWLTAYPMVHAIAISNSCSAATSAPGGRVRASGDRPSTPAALAASVATNSPTAARRSHRSGTRYATNMTATSAAGDAVRAVTAAPTTAAAPSPTGGSQRRKTATNTAARTTAASAHRGSRPTPWCRHRTPVTTTSTSTTTASTAIQYPGAGRLSRGAAGCMGKR